MGNSGDVLGFFGSPIDKDADPSEPPPAEPDDESAAALPAGPMPEVETERAGFEDAIKKNPRLRPFIENALFYLQASHQAKAEFLGLAGDDALSGENRMKLSRILEKRRRENFSKYAEALKDLGLFPNVSAQPSQWDDGPSFVEIHRRHIGEVRGRTTRGQIKEDDSNGSNQAQRRSR
ncbi:MAG: hypothetical protein L6Q38_03325 [Nitrospira sp.]|nr:hypothetical protein [Nitrospira sp.]